MKLYTATGDKGSTSLIGGERVPKYDERVEAYGTVDELGAFTALLCDRIRGDERLADLCGDLTRIGCDLMTVEALLAVGRGGEQKVAALESVRISWLEGRIDALQAEVPPLTKFTLPGGHETVSLCHVCRTVCRRAERRAVHAVELHEEISPDVCIYLNRLADYLYIAGRAVTHRLDVTETEWLAQA